MPVAASAPRAPAALRLSGVAAAAVALWALAGPGQAAERHWRYIGGCASADWLGMPAGRLNAESKTTCWASTSTGVTGQQPPTSADDVFLVHDSTSLDLGLPLSLTGRNAFVANARDLFIAGTAGRSAALGIGSSTLKAENILLGAALRAPLFERHLGHGVIKQSGGAVEAHTLLIGMTRLYGSSAAYGSASGRYELSGGSLDVVGGGSSVVLGGFYGHSEMVQTGGSFKAQSMMIHGLPQEAQNAYRLSSGQASIDDVSVGLWANASLDRKSGLLEVRGTGSLQAGTLSVEGPGVMRLLDGGSVTVRSLLVHHGELLLNSGTLEITGAASFTERGFYAGDKQVSPWQFGSGINGDSPTLRLAAGASMDVGTLVVGHVGNAALDMLAGATLKSGSSAIGTGAKLTICFSLGCTTQFVPGDGHVRVNGAGATWAVDGVLDIGQAGRGVLRIGNGAVVTSQAGAMGSTDNPGKSPGLNLARIDGQGARWSVAGDLSIGGGQTSKGNDSDLIVDGGQLQVGGTLRVWGGSYLQTLGAGAGVTVGGLVNQGDIHLEGFSAVEGALRLLPGSVLRVHGEQTQLVVNGPVDMAGGAAIDNASRIDFNGRVALHQGALLSGEGMKNFSGGLAIGDSPGTLQDTGSLRFLQRNVYEADIGQTAHDQLNVGGTLHLGGSLKLLSWDGYGGQAGDSFLLFGGSLVGHFSHIDAFGLLPGLRWDTSELHTAGVLKVSAVPEPGTVALWLAGLAAMGCMARRRPA